MLFNSFSFIVFFPIVVLVYFLLPCRYRYIWLLASSYYFYMNWSVKHAFLLLLSTTVTYMSGIALGYVCRDKKEKKFVVGLSLVINLGILVFFKYANMIPGVELNLLPVVGISFYTFQALSYTMDVYRGEIKPEVNFLRYALFVSFFPQLVAGPIERSSNLLPQVNTTRDFDFDRAREGLYLMLWGFFLKICIADRVKIFVDTVYGDTANYTGVYLVIASVLFAIQIYCDFAGYSTIAVGASKILGFDLMRNFDAPYLSTSVTAFWKRWHISLTSWFRDYLYIPLGGNRKGKVRKLINVMIVFLVSGLWHGAAWHFVVWGGLNGLYQVIENVSGLDKRVTSNYLINFFRGVVSFVLVDIAWIFFRAETIEGGIQIIKSIFTTANYNEVFSSKLFEAGISVRAAIILGVCIIVLVVADIIRRRKIDFVNKYKAIPMIPRCVITALAANIILLIGTWGTGLAESAFIYFQF